MRKKSLKRRVRSEPPLAARSDAAPMTAHAESKSRQHRARRVFVLDTNVLMHDPTCIFRFEEHDVYLPMVVLEELDAHKKGMSEASRNVRQASRFLDDIIRGATKEQIDRGLALPSGFSGNHGKKPSSGRLYFQTRPTVSVTPALQVAGNDHAIPARFPRYRARRTRRGPD